MAMVNVLLVGHGARENALAEAVVKGGANLIAYMGKNNPGIRNLAQNRVKIGSISNFHDIGDFGLKMKVDFVIIGPEAPLAIGISNALQAIGLPTIGPTIECAQLESSKIFMRELLAKYQLKANIAFQNFQSMEGIPEFVEKIGLTNVVVKPDGLTGGKGVKVFGDHLHSMQDIADYCNEIFDHIGHVIIEERLEGEEFTYICFVDGTHVVGTPIVQDNKRAYNGDQGPNTGGMGSYSMENHLMPFITKQDVQFAKSQVQEVVDAIKKETGQEYKGFLYGQFMKTARGIKIVEFNIRFGDPEAMNILPILKTNFVEICQQILAGTLTNDIEFEQKATVCKYLVPEGYPISPQSQKEVEIDTQNLQKIGAKIYYASVDKQGDQIFTTSSRAIAILGIADTIEEAEKIAEQGVQYVSGPLFHRSDIGTLAMIEARTMHMKSLEK
jgi:phosphoribosylamine--glycine ligase